MAASIPEALKSADITRFATRATQVERAKPAIAYWCYYWIVQQIVTRGLHKSNEECMNYTVQLMDKLEVAKSTDDEAIKDEIVAKALIEQFGLDIFSKADNAVRANKASRQTADTFQAAATFLELLQIWPPLEAEIAAKIKFAKYHAVRIAKAIKAGEDPNASNPVPEVEDEINGIPTTNSPDPQIQAMQSPPPPSLGSEERAPPLHPRTYPDAASARSSPVYPTAGNGPSSPHHNAENYYHHNSRDVSPIGPPSVTGPPSIGGGYFPRASNDAQPSPTSDAMDLPSAPDASDVQPSMPSFDQPSPPALPTAFSQGYTPASATNLPPQPHPTTLQHHPGLTQQAVTPVYAPAPEPMTVVDDQAMNEATKHARWAISALNFEDVPTAIKELRGALELLGARGPW